MDVTGWVATTRQLTCGAWVEPRGHRIHGFGGREISEPCSCSDSSTGRLLRPCPLALQHRLGRGRSALGVVLLLIQPGRRIRCDAFARCFRLSKSASCSRSYPRSWHQRWPGAIPLTYRFQPTESDLHYYRATCGFDVTIDTFLGVYEGTAPAQSSLPRHVSTYGSVVADVGLPHGFDGGASGITIDSLEVTTPWIGSSGFFGQVDGSASMQVGFGLVNPLDSPLILASEDTYLLGGTARIQPRGIVNLRIRIPSVPIFSSRFSVGPFEFPAAPEDQLLTGYFSGSLSGTELELFMDSSGFSHSTGNPIFDPLTISEGLPPGINSVTLTPIELTAGFYDDALQVVATNPLPIPEPTTALLLAIGLAGLAVAGRRKQRG